MKTMSLTAAFAHFGVKPTNARWSWSAVSDDGKLLCSLCGGTCSTTNRSRRHILTLPPTTATGVIIRGTSIE